MTDYRSLGEYRLIAELGHGGMAEVFLAMFGGPSGLGFTKLAVIKRLRRDLVEDPEFTAMLVDEARIAARLSHPNVVQTLEVGVENGEYFLTMEFLDGQPLHRIKRRADKARTPLAADLGYVVVADVLAGLHYAHDLADYDGTPLSIVHRDVTPHNVFVTYDGQVKVVDFGIAKAACRASETKEGVVKGKVKYMSPEQAMGSPLERRSDIFAVGVLLWEAATQKRFWGTRDELDVVQSLVAGEFEASPRAVAADVPPEIDAMCRKALALDPADRYASAAEFHKELETFLGDRILQARRELGPLVAALFAKERRALRDVIESASKATASASSVTHAAPRNDDEAAIPVAVGPARAHGSRHRWRAPLVAGVILSALGAAIFGSISIRGASSGAVQATAGAVTHVASVTHRAADPVARPKAGVSSEAFAVASAAPTYSRPAPPARGARSATGAVSSAPAAGRRPISLDTADPWGGAK